jgi:hypothetical protein
MRAFLQYSVQSSLLSTLLAVFLVMSTELKAQSKKDIQAESILTSKKWVCLNVKRKKLQKMDFRIEVGNELSMSIDKKYAFKNNDYNFSSGTWKLDKKMLYFFFNASDGSNRVLSSRYKIKKLTKTQLVLKRLDNPKGVLELK